MPAEGPVVKLDVFSGGVFPGIVGLHPVPLDLTPHFGPGIGEKRLINSLEKFICPVGPELEAITGAGHNVERFHRIVQASNCPDDRHGAVSQRVHLIKAARLKF